MLIALLALLAMGGLYFLVSNLTPELIRGRNQQKTGAALTEAREALIGYAVRFREDQLATGTSGLVYGYLPLPDLGTSRNNNTGCAQEGCDAANFAGNASNITAIGRFPWRTLGTGPLRDSHGECLWYAVSGSHQRIQRGSPMNWDTLSQMDVVVANGTAAMISAISSAHDRPIAVIFSPGPPLAGQDRGPSTTDTVTECGGNYVVSNYLDPSVASNLSGVTNYLAGSTNSASGDTASASKSLSAGGEVNRRSDGTLWAGNCPSGDSSGCSVVANDTGIGVTSELLFRTLRGSSYFRTDINAMLERMTTCLRDQIAAGTGFTPDALSGFTPPANKTVGRVPSSTCYDDAQHPLGYFSHYRDQIFVAQRNSGNLKVELDGGASQQCAGALIFGSQRGTKNPVPTDSGESLVQLRTSAAVSTSNTLINTNWPANYLEATNLIGFTTVTPANATDFAGHSLLAMVSASQTANQDIVRCIPTGANFTLVESPNLSAAQQLVAYDAATSTLTLGKENVTNATAGASNLFGCAWTADEKALGSGFRSYFQFTFADVLQPSGSITVGNTGFVFSVIDSESNPNLPCGMAGSHLGYSGDNGSTPYIRFPKIGIEFDQSRNGNFDDGRAETSTNKGRNDPCYTCGSGTVNSHAAIIYWGHESSNGTDNVNLPDNDDNVHGFPTAASFASTRRPPTNPNAAPGIVEKNIRTGGQVFHVRVEITPMRAVDTAATENSKTSMQTRVWILADSATVANQIIAMQNTTRPMSELYSSFTATLSDTADVFDIAESACSAGTCPTNQTCGTDNVCYRQGLRTARLGFTGSQRTQTQELSISKMFSTWLP
ncbi:MAG: hypothetical protein M0Z99_25385 [Betaproteobacteria bacterium]|nr:hypothetical protein [Betaproteobacteria bacterium]